MTHTPHSAEVWSETALISTSEACRTTTTNRILLESLAHCAKSCFHTGRGLS